MDTSGREPQTAELFTGYIQQQAVAAVIERVRRIENPEQVNEAPTSYLINGLWFTLNLDDGSLSIENPHQFDVHNPEHLEALEVAQEIFKEISALYGILAYLKDYKTFDAVKLGGDAKVEAMMARIEKVISQPVVCYLPKGFQVRIKYLVLAFSEVFIEKRKRDKRASANHGFVYLVQSPTGSYKIGRTKDPDNRMKTFSVKLPFEVDYVCVIETGDMYQLERSLHQQYASKRVNGEWFMLDTGDVECIKRLVVEHGYR